MRITPNSSADNALYYIQQGRAKLDKISEQLASSQNIVRPSDDPIATNLLLNIADRIKTSDQYKSNIDKTQIQMQITSTALQGMYDTVELAKKLASSLVNGSSDSSILTNSVSQLQTLKQQLIDYGNTRNGETYIFAGSNSTTAPFASKTGNLTTGNNIINNIDVTGLSAGMQISGTGIPAGTTITGVTTTPPQITISGNATVTATSSSLSFYAGNETTLSINIADSSTMKMNIPGNQILTADTATSQPYGSVNILKSIDDLITAVGSNDAAAINAGAQALVAGAKQVNAAQNEIATRQIRLNTMETMNTNNRSTLMTVVDNVQAVDYAKLGVELTQQQTAFQASLSATAKLTQLSLLDYVS